ncbi:uncharacterized protein LOC132917579 [Rhopalosiphum padi]|uniref:uncharacterized protein LOC132917579 n=1 Tax=Rhopalosiphum padi TaxID=40932 RepID=UPI00298E9595|nr:uncharacterized protein LOC132917579 [Rhopalosiphum padi]
MLFAFMLASTLAASAVLGRSSGPTPTRVTYMQEEQIQGQIDESAQVVAVGDRSSNLKFVMAIQSSSIWTDVKQRSLTINSTQRLDDATAEKSPNDLSDKELAKLKQACHDGLKCVAVDQLLVLKQVREPLGDGNTSVRMAITKITQVITKYTTEYHEDVYQYEEVTQSDDPSKVYESVTTIVEDNKELCQIDLVPDKREKNTTDVQKTVERQTHPSAAVVIDNNNTVDYDTTNNYNINDGTVNSATINKEPFGKTTIVESPEPGPDGRPDTGRMVIVIAPRAEPATADGGNIKNRSPNGLPAEKASTDNRTVTDDDGAHKRVRQQRPRNSGTSADRRSLPASTADDDRRTSAGRPDTAGGSADANRSVKKNNATVKNEGRKTESDTDVVSAGSDDRASVRKGYVSNGTLNNGNMVEYDINNGTVNTGRIDGSTADKGIISVGTVNNGPVNYGTSNTHTNNGNRVTGHGNDDVRKYLSSIEKMYSTILERLG